MKYLNYSSLVIDTTVIIRLLLSNNSYSFLAFEDIVKKGYELKRVLQKKIFKRISQEEKEAFFSSYY